MLYFCNIYLQNRTFPVKNYTKFDCHYLKFNCLPFPLFVVLCFCLVQKNDGSHKIAGDSLKNVYKLFLTEYPIISIKDPFDETIGIITQNWRRQWGTSTDCWWWSPCYKSKCKLLFCPVIIWLLLIWLKCWFMHCLFLMFNLQLIVIKACGESHQGQKLQCSSAEANLFVFA